MSKGGMRFIKRAFLFCSALAFLATDPGCASGPAPMNAEELHACSPGAPAREVRILTMNVWTGLDYKGFLKMGRYKDDDPEKRYRLLVSGIQRLGPDIIAVQEANPLPDYADRLSADLGYQAVYHVSNGGFRFGPAGFPVNLRQGEVILVKKPWTLVDLGDRQLSGPGFSTNWLCMQMGEIRKANLARAVVNGKPLYIYGVHLHAGPFKGTALDWALQRLKGEAPAEDMAEAVKRAQDEISRRRREVAALKGFVNETLPRGVPAIMLGCFNTDTGSGDLDPLMEDGWQDSYLLAGPGDEGYTWDPGHNPNFHEAGPSAFCERVCSYHESRPLRIDLILVSRDIPGERVTGSCVVLKPSNGAAPSDHYGVLTTITW